MPRNIPKLKGLPHLAALPALVLALGVPCRALRAEEPAPEGKEARPNSNLFPQEPEYAPPLSPTQLQFVTDSAGLPILPEPPRPDNKDRAKERAYWVLFNEYQAYCEAVVKASTTSTKAFAHGARHDLTYAHLFSDPAKYRGQVVHVEGRLKRVRRFDAPTMVAQAGVPSIYEGWVFAEGYGVNPTCIVFTELPAGLPVAEDMHYQVSFDGYFFKKYRYRSADSKPGQAREAPLLVGRAPVVLGGAAASAEEPASPWSLSGTMLVVLFALILGTLGMAFGLHVWFRRHDNGVRARVAGARAAAEFQLDSPEGRMRDEG